MSDEWRRHAEVMSVQCNRSQLGELQSIRVRVEYFEYQEDDDGNSHSHQNGEKIRFKFKTDGYNEAILHGWKDASEHSGWVKPAVFRCLPAAAEAVKNVPEVEQVEDLRSLFDAELKMGSEAWETARDEL